MQEMNPDARVSVGEGVNVYDEQLARSVISFADAFARGDESALGGMFAPASAAFLDSLVMSGAWYDVAAEIDAVRIIDLAQTPGGSRDATEGRLLLSIETASNDAGVQGFTIAEGAGWSFDSVPTTPETRQAVAMWDGTPYGSAVDTTTGVNRDLVAFYAVKALRIAMSVGSAESGGGEQQSGLPAIMSPSGTSTGPGEGPQESRPGPMRPIQPPPTPGPGEEDETPAPVQNPGGPGGPSSPGGSGGGQQPAVPSGAVIGSSAQITEFTIYAGIAEISEREARTRYQRAERDLDEMSEDERLEAIAFAKRQLVDAAQRFGLSLSEDQANRIFADISNMSEESIRRTR